MQFTREAADEAADRRLHPERFVVITLHNTETTPSPRAGSSPRDDRRGLQYAIAPRTRATARELAVTKQIEAGSRMAYRSTARPLHRVPDEAGESQSDLLRRLRSDARVESAQPSHSFDTLASTYNDLRGPPTKPGVMGVTQAHAWSRGKASASP